MPSCSNYTKGLRHSCISVVPSEAWFNCYANITSLQVRLWMPQVGSLEREVGSLERARCRDIPLFLYDWTIRYKQVVPIPNISFTCPQGGRITNLTFIARSHFESSLETVIYSCRCGTRMWMVHVRYSDVAMELLHLRPAMIMSAQMYIL